MADDCAIALGQSHLNLYQRIAEDLATAIANGEHVPGERVPSVRELARRLGVSISTVTQAYGLLVDRGVLEARPQSGYYVGLRARASAPEPSKSRPAVQPMPVSTSALTLEVLAGAGDPGLINLGNAVAAPDLLPTASINRCLMSVIREMPELSAVYDAPFGRPELRAQVVRLAHGAGVRATPEEVLITGGCQEGVTLCLRALARPGDTIAVESPTFFGTLQAIESLGMHALEIPTHPRTGICLDALEQALAQWPIRACVVMPTNANPVGSCMELAERQKLVELLARHEIPLIEDDACGDLGFAPGPRPPACKAWDRDGGVLLCSSFSKTLGPGYRLGWIAAGRFAERVRHLKQMSSFAPAPLQQVAIARFLARGSYDRHIARARAGYAQRSARVAAAVAQHFPAGTRVAQPAGGTVLWVELPDGLDTLTLYRRAHEARISFAPGALFTAQKRYRNALRLYTAPRFDERMDTALRTLGLLAQQMQDEAVT